MNGQCKLFVSIHLSSSCRIGILWFIRLQLFGRCDESCKSLCTKARDFGKIFDIITASYGKNKLIYVLSELKNIICFCMRIYFCVCAWS